MAIAPLEITYVVVSVVCGRLSDRYGSVILSTAGLITITCGLLILSLFNGETSYLQIAVGLSILGVGNGMFTSPNSSAIMGSVPADRRGIASAFWNMMFQIGLTASYGLAVLMIASVVPYNAFSTLLQGSIASSVASIARNEFFNGFRLVTLIFVAIDLAAIGIVFAGSRARIIRY